MQEGTYTVAFTPRILVTRARHQGSELADRLRELGLEPVAIPAIEIVEPTSFIALDAALASLQTFDWLVFTSANAVEAFRKRLERDAGIRSEAKRQVRDGAVRPGVAAIGASTARALEEMGLTPDVIPPQAVAESLSEALLPYARKPGGAAARFLLVRAEDAREHLVDALCGAGAEVTIAPAYRTVVASGSIALVRELFREPGLCPDAITFTSSSTVRNLLALCEAAEVMLPEGALRVSIGPITSRTLRDVGLAPHAEAPEATVACLAATVAAALRARADGQ